MNTSRISTHGLTCGEALVQLLQAYGVNHIFGIPGVHTVALYRGLKDSGLRHITPRHEQGAGFMADGYARVSGQPGVCFIITGPGMTNILTAMAQAYADSIPMLVISSVNRTRDLGLGNGRLHELPGQREMISGACAFSHTLMHPDDLPQLLAQAFAVFHSQRPRPVHIEIPIDLIDTAPSLPAWTVVKPPARPMPDAGAVAQAAQWLNSAQRPLLLLGGGAVDAQDAVAQLLARCPMPTALTINAKGLLPPDHPWLIGSTQSLQATRALVAQADVILAAGTELGETDYDVVFDGQFALNGRLIRLDIDALQIMRNHLPDLALLGDARLGLEALERAWPDTPTAPRAPGWQAQDMAQLRLANGATLDGDMRCQAALLERVRRHWPEVIFAGDSTQTVYTGNLSFDASAPRRWFNSSTGYGTLGYGLPAALGAALGATTQATLDNAKAPRVVCLIGDGGLQFTLPELASAVEARIPVVVLIWNNVGYAEIKKYMLNNGVQPIGVDIHTPDFVAVAQGMGCRAHRITSPAELDAALLAADQDPTPLVLDLDANAWAQSQPT